MQANSIPKILIIRLSSLGDIVHTYPMLYDIKKHLGECQVDWLVDESFIDLVKLNHQVDNVIAIPLRRWKKNKLGFLSNLKTWKNNIKHLEYDYIIDSQGLVKSALLAKCFTGKVYGLGKNSIREKLASYLYNEKIETGKKLLALTKNRVLASKVFGYQIDQNIVNFGLDKSDYPELKVTQDKKYIIFFHATSKESKKYPVQYWVDLANFIIKKYDFTIILPYGSAKEKSESINIQELIASPNVIVPEVRFSYAELSGLISHAEFVFGVDTGLIHLANALNKKLIAIYIDTDPAKTGIFESNIAKNLGNIDISPACNQLIDLFENILEV